MIQLFSNIKQFLESLDSGPDEVAYNGPVFRQKQPENWNKMQSKYFQMLDKAKYW